MGSIRFYIRNQQKRLLMVKMLGLMACGTAGGFESEAGSFPMEWEGPDTVITDTEPNPPGEPEAFRACAAPSPFSSIRLLEKDDVLLNEDFLEVANRLLDPQGSHKPQMAAALRAALRQAVERALYFQPDAGKSPAVPEKEIG